MYRLFFISLFIGLATSFRPASRFCSRRSTTAVRVIPDDAAGSIVYAAQFDPVQFVTAGSILTTFFFVQRQINRSNALLESLKVAKDELKRVRNEAMSGTNDAEKISELGLTIKQLEQEWRDTATLRLPGYTVRYRVQRPDLIPEEDQEVVQTNDSQNQSIDVSSKVSATNTNELPFKLKDMTPLQAGLLIVGVVVVAAQVWLLGLMSVDPMSAPSTINYNPLNLPPPQPLLDSFNQ